MSTRVYVSAVTASEGSGSEAFTVQLLVQYGKKSARIEVEVNDPPELFDHSQSKDALLEMLEALLEWRDEGEHIYSSPRPAE